MFVFSYLSAKKTFKNSQIPQNPIVTFENFQEDQKVY